VKFETITPLQGIDEMKGKVMLLLVCFRNTNIWSAPRFPFILNINTASLDSVVLGK